MRKILLASAVATAGLVGTAPAQTVTIPDLAAIQQQCRADAASCAALLQAAIAQASADPSIPAAVLQQFLNDAAGVINQMAAEGRIAATERQALVNSVAVVARDNNLDVDASPV